MPRHFLPTLPKPPVAFVATWCLSFRGIPGDRIYRWLAQTGRKKGVPARLKSFRFKPEDLRLLRALARELGVSETEVVRRGLRALV